MIPHPGNLSAGETNPMTEEPGGLPDPWEFGQLATNNDKTKIHGAVLFFNCILVKTYEWSLYGPH